MWGNALLFYQDSFLALAVRKELNNEFLKKVQATHEPLFQENEGHGTDSSSFKTTKAK